MIEPAAAVLPVACVAAGRAGGELAFVFSGTITNEIGGEGFVDVPGAATELAISGCVMADAALV